MAYFRDNIAQAEGYVPGFQPARADVVKLNTNENPYPPSPKVLEAVVAVDGEMLRRYPPVLADPFRTAAAEVLEVPSDHILCTNGGDDLLTICFRAFCDEHRPVAYPTPTYSLYAVLANLQNCPAVEVPFESEDWLDALAGASAALTVVCNPNAPTTHRVDPANLAALAGRIEGVLLIDEAYVDFADGDCLQLARDFENVILLRSLSKGYSLAGLRFGFGIAQPKLIEGLIKVKDSYNVDAVAIAAATAAIRDQVYFRANVERIRAERTRLTAALRDLGLEVPDSQTNFVWARSPKAPARSLHQNLAEQDVYVRYFDRPGLDDRLRITIGTPEQNDRLLAVLQELLAG